MYDDYVTSLVSYSFISPRICLEKPVIAVNMCILCEL